METVSSIRDSIRLGDLANSLHLTDAYFHVPIDKRDRKRLCFVLQRKGFQFRALPFGLSRGPWIFTRVAREPALYGVSL